MAQEFNKQQGQNQNPQQKPAVAPARQDQGSHKGGEMDRERDLDSSKTDRSSTGKERI